MELGWCVLLTHCFNNQLGVNFLPHELQASISELREIEVNAKIEGVFVVTWLSCVYNGLIDYRVSRVDWRTAEWHLWCIKELQW